MMLSRHVPGMAHDVFDLDAARKVFDPLERQLGGEDISSPFDLYSIETLRDHHQLRVGQPDSTDVFVWAQGEPTRREITKVGGLPYWPVSEPWPATKKGKPYNFIAQFNFQDSRDIHLELPADVLVLFAKDGDNWKYEPNTIMPVWVHVRDRELIQQLPQGVAPYEEFVGYGVRFRTADYPDSWDACYERVESAPYSIPELRGTKIGGVPGWIQRGGDFSNGKFLCQLGSIQASPETPWPWVNSPEPLLPEGSKSGLYAATNQLMIGDAGSLYLFLYPDGDIRMYSECY